MNLAEIARRENIKYSALQQRVNIKGQTVEEAIQGIRETKEKQKWYRIAKENGLSDNAYNRRILRGWPREKAATTPVPESRIKAGRAGYEAASKRKKQAPLNPETELHELRKENKRLKRKLENHDFYQTQYHNLKNRIVNLKATKAKLQQDLKDKAEKAGTNHDTYTTYIQFAGRAIKIGTYESKEAAEEAEKRAIKELN